MLGLIYYVVCNIVFSRKDFPWIKEVFWKNQWKGNHRFDLETDYGFRFMIHERDWIAGRTIRANIMDGIDKSRRIIFVFSRYKIDIQNN